MAIAIPLMLAQLINVLYNLVDRVFIGHIPGADTTALTGVGLCLPIITIISAFTSLFGFGGAPLFSMARGAGEERRARHIMGNAFFSLIMTGVVLAALCFAFRRPILYMFGAGEETYVYANAYISVYLTGTVFVMIGLGMNPFISAQGSGVVGMLSVLIGAVLNILLDPLFIFVFHMGVTGAALATVISQGISAAWVLSFLMGKRAAVRLSFGELRPDLGTVGKISAMGVSGFIVAVTDGSVQLVFNVTLKRCGGPQGDMYVSVMTVVSSIWEVIIKPITGFTNGVQPVISFNYGAKRFDRVKSAIKFLTVGCTAYTGLAWVVLLLFPEPFILAFNDDPELLRLGVPAIRLYFCGIFLMGLQHSSVSTLVALGLPRQAAVFSILRKVVVVIPLTILLPRLLGLGAAGAFLAEPASDLVGLVSFTTMILTARRLLSEEPIIDSAPAVRW